MRSMRYGFTTLLFLMGVSKASAAGLPTDWDEKLGSSLTMLLPTDFERVEQGNKHGSAMKEIYTELQYQSNCRENSRAGFIHGVFICSFAEGGGGVVGLVARLLAVYQFGLSNTFQRIESDPILKPLYGKALGALFAVSLVISGIGGFLLPAQKVI